FGRPIDGDRADYLNVKKQASAKAYDGRQRYVCRLWATSLNYAIQAPYTRGGFPYMACGIRCISE
ncbi:MAG: hypothetical protein ACE5G0_23055, partial [Rhodothermales bacterium]